MAEAKTSKKDEKKLSKNVESILESVKKLSVLELSELVKALEEEFGVSAAAPVMVAGGGATPQGGAGAQEGAAEEKSSFNLELTSAGAQKIAVIKVVRELTQLGLKEAKDLVDNAPKVVKEDIKKEEAEEMKKKLEEAGATITLK